MDSDNKVLQALSIIATFPRDLYENIYTHTHSAIIGQHIFFI